MRYAFTKSILYSLNSSGLGSKKENKTLYPYKIRVKTKKEAKKIQTTINEFCIAFLSWAEYIEILTFPRPW